MSLVRNFCTPSDRMSLIWTLLNLENIAILEYGPSGTTHFSIGTMSSMGLDVTNKLFVTHIGENDVVMGDTTRLEDAILEIDEKYNYEYIFIIGSSISSIIGTDIKGISYYLQTKVKSKLIPFDVSGLTNDYAKGIKLAHNILLKEVIKDPTNKIPNSYNMLGISSHTYRINSDIIEIQEILSNSLNLNMHAALFNNCEIKKVESLANAEVNIVIGKSGLKLAKKLEKKYLMPYIEIDIYGYDKVLKLIDFLGTQFNIIPDENYIKTVKEHSKNAAMIKRSIMYSKMMHSPIEKKAVIIGDYNRVKGISEFVQSLQIDVVAKIVNHKIKENDLNDFEYFKIEKDKINRIKDINNSIIFADDISLRMANESNLKITTSFPYLNKAQFAKHMPLMGIKGSDYILEKIYEYISNLGG